MKGFVSLLALAACAAPLFAGEAPRRAIVFTDVTEPSGVRFKMTAGKDPSTQLLEVKGSGVAMLDYDNDGDLDLFFANGATMDEPANGPGSRLYANSGGGKFSNVTGQTGIDIRCWGQGVAVGDYDADGYDDIYVTCYGPNVLLHNVPGKKGRRFVDVTADAGVGDDRWGSSAAFADLDGDDDLDLYVTNYFEFDLEDPPERRQFKGAMVFGGPMDTVPQHDVLYENLGGGKFRDAGAARGCKPEKAGYGLGVVILDFDGDGQQDIYVGNDSVNNFLFFNRGEGKFEDRGVISGIASNLDGREQATMGIAVGDVDDNGLPDVFTTNFSSDTNTLHTNLGKGLFDDRTSQYGLGAVSRPYLSWGTGLFDYDSDGDEDLLIVNGHIYPQAGVHEMDTQYEQPVLVFERRGKRFSRAESIGEITGRLYRGRAAAFGDIDDDGDVDVVMTTLNDYVRVFRNDSPPGRVVVVGLKRKNGNRNVLGSVVELIAGDEVQRRWIYGGSFKSVSAPLAYFALRSGNASDKVTIRVTWPDGKVTEHPDVPVDRRITVTHGKSSFKSTALRGR